MTNEEALNHFKNHEYMTDYSWQDEMSEIAIKAIDKQIPKKIKIEHRRTFDTYECECGTYLGNSFMMVKSNYCISCGQKIDWGESE